MTEQELKIASHWLERLQSDLDALRERLHVYADADGRPAVPDRARVVNTQDSTQDRQTEENKQKQTCVCVNKTVSVHTTEGTHTTGLGLDFVLGHLPQGVPDWYARYWHGLMCNRGWKLKDGHRITSANWNYYLAVFHSRATPDELSAARRRAAGDAPANAASLAWLYGKRENSNGNDNDNSNNNNGNGGTEHDND